MGGVYSCVGMAVPLERITCPRFLFMVMREVKANKYLINPNCITKILFEMKKIISLLMALAMVVILPFQSWAQAEIVRLKNGTAVEVETTLEVTSDHSGDIQGKVVADVYAEDGVTVLIQKGAPVKIHATYQDNGATGKAGKILINGASTIAVDGKTISLYTSTMEVKGKGKGGLAWGLGIGTGLVTLFGLLFLLIKGEDATIPAGTAIQNVSVEGNYSIIPQ